MAEKTTGTQNRQNGVSKKACALLWDESFTWGLMARKALTEAGLPFDLLRSDEIRQGALSRYRMLYVPGGWASQKLIEGLSLPACIRDKKPSLIFLYRSRVK